MYRCTFLVLHNYKAFNVLFLNIISYYIILPTTLIGAKYILTEKNP